MVVNVTVGTLVPVGSYLDGRNVAQVRSELASALDRAGGDLVLDMSGVERIDAAGLGMLTAVHVRAERAGRRLVLRHCSDELRRVFAVTRLNRLFNIERSLQLSG